MIPFNELWEDAQANPLPSHAPKWPEMTDAERAEAARWANLPQDERNPCGSARRHLAIDDRGIPVDWPIPERVEVRR